MNKFLIQISIFAGIFFVFDKLFYLFIVMAPTKEADTRLEQVMMGGQQNDLIILGSSRAARNLLASEIEQHTGLTSYNYAYPGSDIRFHDFVLETYLRFNKAPRYVLLTVDDPIFLRDNPSLVFRYDRLYPLVSYKWINETLVKQGIKNKWLSRFFMLHRMSKSNFDLRQKSFTALDTVFSDGSMPLSFQRYGRSFRFDSSARNYLIQGEDSLKINAFLQLIKRCKEKNILPVLVFPPNLKLYNPTFENRILSLAGPDIPFLRYDTTNPGYRSPSNYYDESHLLRNPAISYSRELAVAFTYKVLKMDGIAD